MGKGRIAVIVVFAILFGLGMAASNRAEATTVYVNSYPGLSGISVTGYSNGSAGEFQLGIGSSSTNAAGFCVDFSKGISVGQSYTSYTFTPASGHGLTTQLAAWIMSNYSPGLGQTSWYSSVSGANENIARAAVQFALWEVTQESLTSPNYNLLTGSFKVTTDPSGGIATTLGNNILSNMYSTLYSGGHYTVDPASIANISLAQSPANQNLLTGTVPAPEPGSALLIGFGLAGLGLLKRSRRG